jgi:hypothetical protein
MEGEEEKEEENEGEENCPSCSLLDMSRIVTLKDWERNATFLI